MHKMTAANLRSAYGGESMAHMRYIRWGDRAEEEGFANVAWLFRAIASAEVVHATNHFNVLKDVKGDHLCASMAVFGVGKSEENLAGAIAGETPPGKKPPIGSPGRRSNRNTKRKKVSGRKRNK